MTAQMNMAAMRGCLCHGWRLGKTDGLRGRARSSKTAVTALLSWNMSSGGSDGQADTRTRSAVRAG
jgi:hypothetical protein